MRFTVKGNGHFFSCLIVVISLAFSCKQPDNIGLNVLPASDLSSHSFSDTISLQTSIEREDSVPATGNSANLLGNIHDNLFGDANASFYTRALLSSLNITFGSNPVCDSIVLSLVYSGYYGDTTASHSFEIYKMDESIADSTVYYSNKTFATSDLLGYLTTSDIHPNDSVLLNGVKTAPHLRIPLDNSKAAIFFSAASSVYASNSAFLDFFKGIYIKEVSSPATGSILYFNLADTLSKITLYYKNSTDDSLSFSFYLNGLGKVNHFTHDYSSAVFANQFNNPDLTKNLCYVQSMAGVKTKINFPYLNNLIQDGNISVNLAQLVVTIDNSTTATFPAHSSLFLTGIDSLGRSYFLPDFITSTTGFGGEQTSGTYTFHISRYMQQVLSGTRKDYGLYLVASGASANANRTVIGGSDNPSIRMKLNLNYTNLNP
jgi:hypothetical protein